MPLGLPRERLSVLQGDVLTAELPPYLANLIVSEDLESDCIGTGEVFLRRAFSALRPYGGAICLEQDIEGPFTQQRFHVSEHQGCHRAFPSASLSPPLQPV
jgi:hypothetical protein